MPSSLTDVKQTVTESSLLLNIVWYLLLSAATVFVMWYLSAKNLPWHIRISVFIALGASLSIVIMVPFDVQSVYHLRCQNSTYTLLMDGKEPTCPSETHEVSKVPSLHAPALRFSHPSRSRCRSRRPLYHHSSTRLGKSYFTSPTCRGGFCCSCSRHTTTRGSSQGGGASVRR